MEICPLLASAPTSNRRSCVPSLPRVVDATTDAVNTSVAALNTPISAGDALRRKPPVRQLHRSNSEKTNSHPTPSVSSIRCSNHETCVCISQPKSGGNFHDPSIDSLDDMAVSFMKVSSVKSIATANEQQQSNGAKKKVNPPSL